VNPFGGDWQVYEAYGDCDEVGVKYGGPSAVGLAALPALALGWARFRRLRLTAEADYEVEVWNGRGEVVYRWEGTNRTSRCVPVHRPGNR
jgi:hypothetical protein